MTKRQLELVERNKKIISLWLDGHKQSDIVDLITTLGYSEVKQSQVSSIIRSHESEVEASSYNSRKEVSVEKSLIRSRSETNYQRKVNRESFLETIKNEDMLEMIKNIVSEIKPIEIKPISKSELKKITRELTEEVEYFLESDIHWGAEGTFKKTNKKKYTIVEKLDIIFEAMKNSKAKKLVLVVGGDLFHNLAAEGMHTGMFLDMEIVSPTENIISCSNYFATKLSELLELGFEVEMIGVPGNHPRITKSKNDDPEKVLFCAWNEILKARFYGNNKIKISYSIGDIPMAFTIGNLDFILAHGENGFSSMKLESYKPRYFPRSNKHLVVVSGHLHNLQIRNGWDTTHISLPCIVGSDSYADLFGYRSQTGYVTIKEKNGLPIIQSTFLED